MITISSKIQDRYAKGLKRYQPILKKAYSSDVNESDTVTIITDILCDVFGYDKYENITSEFAIKKTFCDLAVKLNDTIPLLIECKAIGISLKDDHIRQATNYAADSGIEWVVLTNGINWRIYKITFSKPIDKKLVYEFDFTELSAKKSNDMEMLYYLSIEAFGKSSKATLDDYYAQRQIVNKYTIAQIILTDTVIGNIKKYMKKLFPETKVSDDELLLILKTEVLKRDTVEDESALEAIKQIKKAEKNVSNSKITKKSN